MPVIAMRARLHIRAELLLNQHNSIVQAAFLSSVCGKQAKTRPTSLATHCFRQWALWLLCRLQNGSFGTSIFIGRIAILPPSGRKSWSQDWRAAKQPISPASASVDSTTPDHLQQ
jgi:hypothetical protein